MNVKKKEIRKDYEDKFVLFLTSEDNQVPLKPNTFLEKKVFQELILDYNAYISEAKQSLIINQADQEATVAKVELYLNSKNIWKKKTGTYLAGEYRLDSMSRVLLQQLETTDHDLLFVTSKSLIKIADHYYLKEILKEVSDGKRMGKNQVLSLLELVEGNIEESLDDCMRSNDLFLQVIAMEELGKRHYQASILWIRKMISEPQKELRIAAIKAANRIGNIGDDLYLKGILSLKEDTEWEVRAFLAKFLKKVNSDLSVSILKDFMSDSNWQVRHNAAESLIVLGIKGKGALTDLLDAADPFARDAASAVLQREGLD
ncbi:MAG: HEAT repeat domain-containing protein [Alkalibacterium sp.]|nr:HEAT repeat domain-containing protein [Alkalibacterium sp.]